MKKITLTESDLLRIVKRVLNEQYDRRFDEDEIDILHLIFERELKPPFRVDDNDWNGEYAYYNRDNECIGTLRSVGMNKGAFTVTNDPFCDDIRDKVCQIFEFPYYTWDWWIIIKPYLKSWLEDQINIKLSHIF